MSIDDQMREAVEGTPPVFPEGDYAIVELFGHTTLIGRVSEVERFGSKMLSIEPIFRGELLTAVLHGGASIYRFTPCAAEVAFKRAPKDRWNLPAAILATVSAPMLAAMAAEVQANATDDDEDRPF